MCGVMDDELFQKLLQSVGDMKAIMRGEMKPLRTFIIERSDSVMSNEELLKYGTPFPETEALMAVMNNDVDYLDMMMNRMDGVDLLILHKAALRLAGWCDDQDWKMK